MNLSIRERIRRSVVHVICGDKEGTAFFISCDTLLTAYHNIIDHLFNSEIPVEIVVDNETFVCEALPLGNPTDRFDVAILKCQSSPKFENLGLNLLAYTPNPEMELYTLGYPLELCNCTTSFLLPLKYIESISNADADFILVKTSEVSFFSYEGFSGAPIVNSEGSVLGIISLQENLNLRATSIKKISGSLLTNGIHFTDNGIFEDDSPIGLKRCLNILNKNIRIARSKYSPELHQRHFGLESDVEKFIDGKAIPKFKDATQQISQFIERNEHTFEYFGIKYCQKDDEEYPERKFILDILRIPIDERNKLSKSQKKAYDDLISLNQLYEQAEQDKIFYGYKVFGIFGPAGVGKSHMSIHLAKNLINSGYYVYHFLGANFDANSDAETQLLNSTGLSQDHLSIIDKNATNEHKSVIFIIDAINEGAGFPYWELELPNLLRFIERHNSFKLLITGRGIGSGIYDLLQSSAIYDKSYIFELEGFEDCDKALKSYCKHYRVDESVIRDLNIYFQNPLFLSMFCKSYSAVRYSQRKKLDRLTVYSNYITSRNRKISQVIDTDPHLNVTLSAFKKLAEYSMSKCDCGSIEREQAQSICNSIIHRDEWSRNLLNQMILENLLSECFEWEEYASQRVEFEFQNFGDIFRASAIMDACNAKELIEGLVKLCIQGSCNDNQKNCLIAIFGLWRDHDTNYLSNLLSGLPLDYIEEIIGYSNENISEAIVEYFRNNFSNISIGQFFRNSWYLPDQPVFEFHDYLKSMTMTERDLRLIRAVNRNYEYHQRTLSQDYQNVAEDNQSDALRKLMVLAWNCISSHPDYKAILIRQMVRTLSKYSELSVKLLDLFGDVNDEYVRESVLCAIYGTLLVVRDSDLIKTVGEKIYNLYYASNEFYPRNILVRQWSELILDLYNSYTESPEERYINLFPCDSTDNPLSWDISEVSPDILGNTNGGNRLKYNLFRIGPLPSDFNRYILGSNTYRENKHFRTKDGSVILIDDLSKIIAKEIIRLGWNDNLGNIDTMDPPFERYDNCKEKIGKKYLWIAYQNVMALLSDHCNFSYDSIYHSQLEQPNFIGHPSAWMIEGHSLFDPTLLIHPDIESSLPRLKFKSEITNISELVDSPNYPIPILSACDKDCTEWLQIDGWDNWRDSNDDYYGPSAHIQIVSWVIKDIPENRLESVIKKGIDWSRLKMPYDSLYDCLWNEIPWSKRSQKDMYEWEDFLNTRGKYMPLRINQLQEEMSGIDYESRPISNAMTLNWECLKICKLYNAERGIVRSQNDKSIVSFNRDIVEQGCSGLIVRKNLIDTFLKTDNMLMLTAIEYYKSNHVTSWREYEWLIYSPQNGFRSIVRTKEKE